MNAPKIAIVSAILFLSCTLAEAALLDSGTITTDTAQNLNFLDLSETTNISFDDMAIQLNAGGTYADWRYATTAEITALFQNAGIPNLSADTAANTAPVQSLMTLLGGPLSIADTPSTGFHRESLIGFNGDTSLSGNRVIGGYLGVGDFPASITGTAYPGAFGEAVSNVAFAGTGHWLTQSVPEPSSSMLGAFGLVVALSIRRNKNA